MTIYDKIGIAYNATRKADPYLASRLYHFLSPQPNGLYLDIGCGTGNYLKALSDKGVHFYGVDPSEVMLSKARDKNSDTTFIQACAEDIPLPGDTFDGAMAVLTIHHWSDMLKGLQEVNRVMKAHGRLVFFSCTPEQVRGYWLHYYFPEMVERAALSLPVLSGMQKFINDSGFELVATEKYFVKPDLQDHFLYSNKFRPEQYLLAEVRNNASAFSLLSEPAEVEKGVAALKRDIESGTIQSIIADYENELGDYLFLVAEKRKTVL